MCRDPEFDPSLEGDDALDPVPVADGDIDVLDLAENYESQRRRFWESLRRRGRHTPPRLHPGPARAASGERFGRET